MTDHVSLPALPIADLAVADAVPLDELARLADTHAHLLWGTDVARGEAILVSDPDGGVASYVFPYAIGRHRFPPFQDVFDGIREMRAAADDPDADAVDVGRFGSVTVAATRTDVPVLGATHFLPTCFTAVDDAVEVAERETGGPVEVSRLVVANTHDQYFELIGEERRVLVRTTTLEVCDEADVTAAVRAERRPQDAAEVEALWETATTPFPEAIEATDAGVEHTVKTIPLLPLVPVIPWTWWCVPTAESMVLGFWDNVVKGQPAILGYGRLVSHWFEHTHNRNCHDQTTKLWKTCSEPGAVHNNVPSIIDELVDPATGTWRTGYTDRCDLIKKRLGYSFSRVEHPATEGSAALWQALTDEIDAGHPLLWTVPGHAVTAVGYRSGPTGKFAIVYNTWGTHAEQGKIGCQYEEIAHTRCDGLACIIPGGGDGATNLAMMGPDGGEVLDVGVPATITWHVWGDEITLVDVERSVDGGNTWTTIASDLQVHAGFGQHTWVPDAATGKLRIRVTGTTADGTYLAADSSERNVTVTAKPATGWGGWRSFGKPGFDLESLAAIRNSDGRVEVFATAVNGEIRHCYQGQPNSEQWIGWGNLGRPVGRLLSSVDVSAHADGRTAVFGLGDDRSCWYRAQSQPSAGPWTPWASLGKPPGVKLVRFATATYADGRIVLLALADDHAVWHAHELGPNLATWSAWTSLGTLPGNYRPTSISVGRSADGRLEVFLGAIVPDGTEFGISTATVWHRWHTTADTTDSWSGWHDLGPSGPVTSYSRPVVGANADGRLEVFDTNGGELRHAYQPAPDQSSWTVWGSLGRPAPTVSLGSLLVVSRSAQGCLGVFTSGFAGIGPSTFTQCWLREQHTPNDGWAGWVGLDTPPNRSAIALATCAHGDGRRQLFVITAEDRALWYVTEQAA